ncbi:shikimate kinase [uncultured Microbacterium sp.]|uniref:shikimate kinase n=1 Tax=uncultured Microbacterium sp. TaxID=191216 RepID=UPI0035CB0D40
MTSSEAATLVLVGPMGAGKSSIGKKVARELGVTFTDTDTVIVREHGQIPALFDERGEAHFRALERAAVVTALDGGGVVALGGGAVLDAATREDLSAHRVVLLTVAPEIVRARIGGKGRPLLNDGDPIVRWQRIYDERRAFYEQVADVTFDSSVGRISAIAAAIAEWARADGLTPGVSPDTVPEGSE